ncbi:MAG: SpoIIE family protein phosphatase [Candidatus Methanomethylophilaceae archaeon]|nr:SpoIIE family protein phosphatase [Candidatus Methanomethylophilaceae archaeon]
MFKKPSDSEILDEIVQYRDGRADRIVEIIIVAVLVMNVAWIFTGEGRYGVADYIDLVYLTMAFMASSAIICFLLGSHWWTKYLLIGSILVNSFTIIAVMDYSMMILMLLPVVSSCLYYRINFIMGTIVIGALLMLAGLLIYDGLETIIIGMYQGMTRWDRLFSLIKTFYTVDLLIYLLVCIPCYYSVKIGITDSKWQSDLMRERTGIEKEMSNARGIQQGLLITDFPCKPYCDVSSSMSAAKEVGGDFYDCFVVGDDHLAVVIADVSGKGLPASLFMATSMALIRSNVQAGGDLDKAMEKANRELSANNSMKYFVTVWIGVINLRTGDVTYVNAGHNPPFIRKGGKYEMLRSQPDFVFGRKKRMSYNRHHLHLDVGDGIFLYTDGVTEAARTDGDMFKEDRLEKSLSSVADAGPAETIAKVKSDVSEFVGSADQSDDMTMMSIVYTHPYDIEPDEGIRVRADNQGYEKVMGRIKQRMSEAGCSARTITEMETACSEIYANIDMYAYKDKEEKGDVLVTTDVINGAVRITFTDWGIPFNPLEREDPDPILSFKERRKGGLGIMLVKKICDDISYVREGDRNILKLEKEM